MSTNNRQFSQYENLRKTLVRKLNQEGMTYKPGNLANLLLSAFVDSDVGHIPLSRLTDKGVIQPGQFAAWRSDMVRAGILRWEPKTPDGRDNANVFSPGHVIQKHVLKQREDRLVSKTDFDSYRTKTDARLDALESEVRQIIEHYDPPYTDDKRRQFKLIVNNK